MGENEEFLRKVQKHLSWTSVTPTTLRGMLEIGQRKKVCLALSGLPLGEIRTLPPEGYADLLDKWTDVVVKESGAPWGAARKGLNIFLRDALYNFYLREHSEILKHQEQMEIPLDGIIMKKLRDSCGDLERTAVKSLRPKLSARYQKVASDVAKLRNIARVHLDLDWWADQERI